MYILDINIGKIFQAAIVLFRQKEKTPGPGSNGTQDPPETDTVQFCSLEEPAIRISESQRRVIESAILRLLENEHNIPESELSLYRSIRETFRQRLRQPSITINRTDLENYIQTVQNGRGAFNQIRNPAIRQRLTNDANQLLRSLQQARNQNQTVQSSPPQPSAQSSPLQSPIQSSPPQSPAQRPQPASPRQPTVRAVGAGILLARTRLLVAGSRDGYVCPGENIEGECRELHNIESTLDRCNEISEETRRELSGNILRLADALHRKLQPNEFNQRLIAELRGLSDEILTATTQAEQRNTRAITYLRTIVDHQAFNSRLTEGQRSFFRNLHTSLQETRLGSLSNTRLQTARSDVMSHRLAYTRSFGAHEGDSFYRAMCDLEAFLLMEENSRR